MKKLFSLVSMVALILSLFTSCKSNKNINCAIDYIAADLSAINIFTNNTPTFYSSGESINDLSAPKNQQINIFGYNTSLDYKGTSILATGNILTYASNDIIAKFTKNGNLVYLSIDNFDLSECQEYTNEAEYINFCKRLLSEHEEFDFSQYVYSCKSDFTDGFVENCEKYNFRFTKCFSGIPTSDYLAVYINYPNSISFYFDEQMFLDYENINISNDKLDSAIDSFIKENIDLENYVLNSYEIDSKTLCFIDGNLAVLIPIVVYVKNISYSLPIRIAVYLKC